MKVYLIYNIRKGDDENNCYLYAITDDKKLLEAFKEERKMSLFVVKKKDIDKKDYKRFLRENYEIQLTIIELKTKLNMDSPSRFTNRKIKLVGTDREFLSVLSLEDKPWEIGELMDGLDYLPDVFNEEITKALGYFGYYTIFSMTHEPIFCDLTRCYGLENYSYDQFSLFMYLYGDMMRKKL
jgi:hypothetical protein